MTFSQRSTKTTKHQSYTQFISTQLQSGQKSINCQLVSVLQNDNTYPLPSRMGLHLLEWPQMCFFFFNYFPPPNCFWLSLKNSICSANWNPSLGNDMGEKQWGSCMNCLTSQLSLPFTKRGKPSPEISKNPDHHKDLKYYNVSQM